MLQKTKTYRSVTLKLVPTPKQARIIDRNFLRVNKFLNISEREFQKLIRNKAKEDNELHEAHTRLLALLAQRFTKTAMSNLLYPLDKGNYCFIRENNWYKVEIRFEPRMPVRINIDRSNNKYYSDIINGTAYPAFIYKYGSDYFLSTAIPIEKKWEERRLAVFIGIDLNMRKHVASLYNSLTNKFEVNIFFDLKPIDEKIKEIQRKIFMIQKGKRSSQLTEEEKQQLSKEYRRIRKIIEKGHGDFISKLLKVADSYWEQGYNVVFVLEDLKGITKNVRKDYKSFNRWLHSQWCYRRFGILLEVKPYLVKYVDSRNTSKMCHRCNSEVKIYGKHKRLISCDKCGLRDFSRDLNAARNIVKRIVDSFDVGGRET